MLYNVKRETYRNPTVCVLRKVLTASRYITPYAHMHLCISTLREWLNKWFRIFVKTVYNKLSLLLWIHCGGVFFFKQRRITFSLYSCLFEFCVCGIIIKSKYHTPSNLISKTNLIRTYSGPIRFPPSTAYMHDYWWWSTYSKC